MIHINCTECPYYSKKYKFEKDDSYYLTKKIECMFYDITLLNTYNNVTHKDLQRMTDCDIIHPRLRYVGCII